MLQQSTRRLTLRQLLTHSEKCTRDLAEHFQATLLPKAADFRELTRPVRRRSHYPTLLAMQNSLKNLQDAGQQTQDMLDHLHEQLQEIRERARRERVNRL